MKVISDPIQAHAVETIKAQRKKRNMNQNQFAEFVKLSASAIQKYETGEIGITLTAAIAISDACGITLYDFLGVEDKEKKKTSRFPLGEDFVSDCEGMLCSDKEATLARMFLYAYSAYIVLCNKRRTNGSTIKFLSTESHTLKSIEPDLSKIGTLKTLTSYERIEHISRLVRANEENMIKELDDLILFED